MLQLHNVSVFFNKSAGLKNANLSVSKGDFLYITGPTGAGKTTLLRTIYLDLVPQQGHVTFQGFNSLSIKKKHIPLLRRRLGIVFQDFKLLDDRDVFDNIIFALRVTGASSRESKKRAIKALTKVGMISKRNSSINELSGGELQRVCLARAIANNPLIILADEPTGNLDPDTAREIFSLLQNLNRRGIAIIVATHNYKLIDEFPGKVVQMQHGSINKEK